MTSRSFLRTPSEAAGPGDEQVIEDLVDTLEANRSRCVGMAANMIGVGKRIIVFVDEDLGGRITVMLNPVITASDGAFDTQEGCLSLTGERRTLRYRRIEVNYENRRFRARHATFAGWTAQIIQHEVDHCNALSDSYRCSLQPNSRGWSSRLRCDYIATAMTSLFVHWWGGCPQRCWGAMRWPVGFAEGCGWCRVASGWLVGFAGGSLSVGDVPKSGGLASLRSCQCSSVGVGTGVGPLPTL